MQGFANRLRSSIVFGLLTLILCGFFPAIGYCQISKPASPTVIPLTTTASVVEVEPLLKAARGHFLTCDWDQAKVECSKVLTLDSRSVEAMGLLAEIYRTLGDTQHATLYWANIVKQTPLSASDHYFRAEAYHFLGEKQKEMEDYAAAKMIPASSALSDYKLARTYAALGNRQDSVLAYNKLLELSPGCVLALNDRGSAYLLLGEYNLSIKDFSDAIRLKPEFAVSYNNRANAYNTMAQKGTSGIGRDTYTTEEAASEFSSAIRDMDQAIRISPNVAVFYSTRGIAYDALKEYERAVDDYKRAISIKPDVETFGRLGFAYRKMGQDALAVTTLTQAIEFDSSVPDLFLSRGQAYRQLKEYPLAISDYNACVKLDPTWAEAYVLRAGAELKVDDIEGAKRDNAIVQKLRSR